MKPATPTTSLTRMATARMPGLTRAESEARASGPEIFHLRIGSFGPTGDSTTRRPSALISAMVAKAPSGSAFLARNFAQRSGQYRAEGQIGEATTRVAVSTGSAAAPRPPGGLRGEPTLAETRRSPNTMAIRT
jgi:hypothetical protein